MRVESLNPTPSRASGLGLDLHGMVEVVGRVGRANGNHPPVRGPARIGHGGASGAPGHFGRADGKHAPECGKARVSHGGASGRVRRPLLGGARQLPRRACLALLPGLCEDPRPHAWSMCAASFCSSIRLSRATPLGRSRYQTSEIPTTSKFPTELPTHRRACLALLCGGGFVGR